MAGDWIKMRGALCTHPKVIRMAREVGTRKEIGKQLSTGFGGALQEIVTRDVTRDVTLASLLRVWAAANEHTSDGVWHGIDLDDLDHVAGIKGFGHIMGLVGWAVYDAENQTVTFPNFLEYNAPAKTGRGTGAAERQRRYRENHRQKRDVTRDVTVTHNGDVTRDVEKRREEKKGKRARAPGSEESEKQSPSTFPECLRDIAFGARWEEWELHCRDKGRPMTPSSRRAQLAECESHGRDTAMKALIFSISNNRDYVAWDWQSDAEQRRTEKNEPKTGGGMFLTR